MAPGALVPQGPHSQTAKAPAVAAAGASREGIQARRPEQAESPQDTRTDQLRTEREGEEARAASNDGREREQGDVRAASSERREREDTYTANAAAAQFGGGRGPGSVVDLRA